MSPKSFPHTGWNKRSSAWGQVFRLVLRWPAPLLVYSMTVIKVQFSSIDQDSRMGTENILYISKGWLSRNMLGGTAKETFHRRLQLLPLHPWPQGLVAFCSLAVHLQWWVLVAELTFPQVCVFLAFRLQSPLKHPGWLRKEAEGQITALSLSLCPAHHHNFMCPGCIQGSLWAVNNNPITSTRPRYKDFTCINALSILSHRLIQRWRSLASLQRNDEKAQEQLGT